MNLFDTSIVFDIIKKTDATGIISPITLLEVLRGIEDSKRLQVKQF